MSLRALLAGALVAGGLGGACTSTPPNPTFLETEVAWDPLDAETGRVVIYTPTRVLGSGFKVLMARLDSEEFTLYARTFVFADVAAGHHTFKYDHPNLFERKFGGREGFVNFEVAGGETVYVEVDWNDGIAVLTREQAIERLGKLPHRFRAALPFNE